MYVAYCARYIRWCIAALVRCNACRSRALLRWYIVYLKSFMVKHEAVGFNTFRRYGCAILAPWCWFRLFNDIANCDREGFQVQLSMQTTLFWLYCMSQPVSIWTAVRTARIIVLRFAILCSGMYLVVSSILTRNHISSNQRDLNVSK